MESDMRQSGIDVVGKVSWGTHFCQFYETSQDLIETLVPYFREGLVANEFCMWITSAPLQVDQATEELFQRKKDLEKLEMHKAEWKKEVHYWTEQKEAEQHDEQGSATHLLRKRDAEKRDNTDLPS